MEVSIIGRALSEIGQCGAFAFERRESAFYQIERKTDSSSLTAAGMTS